MDWYIVEQDQTLKGEIESARASYNNIVARGWLGNYRHFVRQFPAMQANSDVVSENEREMVEDVSDDAPQSRGKAILRDIVETVALFLVVFTLSQLLLGNFMIEQRSAYPHYVPGDRILVDKVFYRLGGLNRSGMIVGKWQSDSTDVFKRVIGLPGEKVEIINNKVLINGTVLAETYLEPGVFTSLQLQGKNTWQLGADEYFVMGDNRIESGDSRSHGPMLARDIIGRAWVRYWPVNKFSMIK